VPPHGAALSPSATELAPSAPALSAARDRTLALVAPLSDAQLERVFDPIMSPLVWDLAHIAAYEDLWIAQRLHGEELLHPELAALYDAFETPRAVRGDLPLLGAPAARDYLAEVRERTLALLSERGEDDGLLTGLVLQHELQHQETMLQTLMLARIDGYRAEGWELPGPGPAGDDLDFTEIQAGAFELGAPDERFSYDNERPRHEVDLPAFAIGRRPVTNGSWLTFTEGGGYERREWWSDEGWAWKEEYDITHPLHWSGDGHEWRLGGWQPIDPEGPAIHISWFEADAFARSRDARLPTEAEWEKASAWDQVTGTGACWEWTATEFDGYPGFTPHPYREYSEVFFRQGYRVLRGGSWATSPLVATPTFRNWDHPYRRQIFAGVRIARDS
jgi:iron(II)-dependent oxidoreductase